MKNELKISFVLPCYNVAPYVGRCIESIEHQDIPQAEYEVICVDDCSMDNTVDVIREYQKQYQNIRLICHSKNKTAGGARNTGLDAAKGEYIWFVDPDDAVEPDVLNNIYYQASSQNVDILAFNIRDYYENGEREDQHVFINSPLLMNGPEFYLQPYLKGLHSAESVYASIYKRDFLIKHHLHFPEIRASQDVVFTWECVIVAERCSSIADICYNYIHRPNSTTGSRGLYSSQTILSHTLLFSIELQRIIESNPNLDKQLLSQLNDTLNYVLNNISRRIIQLTFKEQRDFYKAMQQYANDIQRFQPKMNRKTQKIMGYNMPFAIWESLMWLYKRVQIFKSKSKE